MIYTKLISGLGNQLFQYTIARQLSINKNIPLKLDTSFFETQNLRSYKLNHFNINAEIASKHEVERILNIYSEVNLYSKVYKKIQNYFPKQYKKYYTEDEWWVYEPEIFKISGNVYLNGYWQHYKYFENISPEIFEELQLKILPVTEVLTLRDQMKNNLNSVAVHIRRGDYITDKNANELMGVLPIEYYYKAINYMSSNLFSPMFYIFSDDNEWVKKEFHINGNIEYVEPNADYIELDLMRNCNHQIIANSSFSWWGAFLNRNPNKIVIAPDKWVLPSDINDKIQIQLPDWIKL